MKPLPRCIPTALRIFSLGFLILPNALLAQSASELTLKDVLTTTLSHVIEPSEADETSPYQASSWLADLPSLSLSYLGSDQRDGVDESEVSINLPVRSHSGSAMVFSTG